KRPMMAIRSSPVDARMVSSEALARPLVRQLRVPPHVSERTLCLPEPSSTTPRPGNGAFPIRKPRARADALIGEHVTKASHRAQLARYRAQLLLQRAWERCL